MGTGFDVEVQPEQIGIIPRAIHHLFHRIQDRADQAREAGQPPPEFKIVAQFMELYNEEVIDLFDPSREQYAGRVSMKIKFVRAIVNLYKMVGGC
jgi:Kinesin-like protein